MGVVLTLLLAAACIAILVAVQVRHVRSVKAQRRAVLDDVASLFDDVEIRQDGIGYPSLTGRYGGDRVKVELVVDTLAMRQLPTLWLMVSVLRRLPIVNPVEILMRPRTSDIVSPSSKLAYEHQPPPGWPIDSRIATAHEEAPRFAELAHALPFLHDPHTKSLLVAPGGVRLVQELARGDISRHRVVRRAKFDATLEPGHLRAVIDVTRAIAPDVDPATAVETTATTAWP